MLTKTLSKVGHSQAIFLDKTVLGLADADLDTVFQVIVEPGKITLRALSKEELHKYTMEKAKEVMKTQAPVLEKLAK